MAVSALATLTIAAAVVGPRTPIATRAVPLGTTGALALSSQAAAAALPGCVTDLSCYTPTQLLRAYHLTSAAAQAAVGRGVTIAVIESFGSPTIARDAATFNAAFHLMQFGGKGPSLRIIYPAGPNPRWGSNPDMVGWAGETTLDVEWAHAMAPGANILVVATPVAETEGTTGFPQMVKAINYVLDRNLANVISMSFGATEATIPRAAWSWLHQPMAKAYAKHVTMVASSGDTGATDYRANMVDLFTSRVVGWPASDPFVTAVGGTYLKLDRFGNHLAPDVVWHDSSGAGGGGLSEVFGRPAWQNALTRTVGVHRGLPDISMSAAVDPGGVVYYHSYPGLSAAWAVVGGTSESAPLFAGIVARAIGIAHRPLGFLNGWLYSAAAHPTNGIVDVIYGNNSWGPFWNSNGNTYSVRGWNAGRGFDLASGLGTVNGWPFVQALSGKTT